ncbi:Hint domain-containing protein [Rhodobacteraceae bacterium NNCM2]|nr:Hint domain-containing protein [Coraliihabitans acroporae]
MSFETDTPAEESAPASRNSRIGPCFVAGTLIRTPLGYIPVEELAEGDCVWTRSNPHAFVRQIAMAEADGLGPDAPIEFAAGILGNERLFRVSPEQRVLIENGRGMLMASDGPTLVAAKDLAGAAGVRRTPCEQVRYHCLLIDTDEVIDSEGALTESLHYDTVLAAGPEHLSQNGCPGRSAF